MSDEEGDGSGWLNMPLLVAMVGVGDYAEDSPEPDIARAVEGVMADSLETSRSRGHGRARSSGRRARSEPPLPPRRSLDTVLEDARERREVLGEREGQTEQAAGARAAEQEGEPEVEEQEATIVFEEYQPRASPERPLVPKPNDKAVLNAKEKDQIVLFYSGLHSRVYVCESTVALYLDSKRDMRPAVTGAPVVVREVGQRPYANRVWLYIAEVGTGIPYFRERLTYRTGYTRVTAQFYVFSPSWDHGSQAALSFKAAGPAHQLALKIIDLMSRLENIGVPIARSQKRSRSHGQKRPKLPSKSEISTPCCFSHMTSMKTSDRDRFLSLRFVTSVPAATLTTLLVPGDSRNVAETRMNSYLPNGPRSALYNMEAAQPLNVSTGQTTGRPRESTGRTSRTAGSTFENPDVLGRNSILASTGNRDRDSGYPPGSWYNPFTDLDRQECTSGTNEQSEGNRTVASIDDPPTDANTTRDGGFNPESDYYRTSTLSCFRALPERARYSRESNPFNQPLTMEMENTTGLQSFTTFARRSVPVNQPQAGLDNSSANPDAHSGPVSRRSDSSNQIVNLPNIDESNWINLEAIPETVCQQSSPLHQPLDLTEYLSSIEVQARSMAISESIHQATPLDQPQIITYQNSFDSLTSVHLGQFSLNDSVVLELEVCADTIYPEISELSFTDSDDDDQTLAVIRAPIDDQTLAAIRASIDDQTLAVIRAPIDNQTLAVIRDPIDYQTLAVIRTPIDDLTLAVIRTTIDDEPLAEIRAPIDDQTLAVIRAPIDDQSLAEIRAPIDDQTLAVIRAPIDDQSLAEIRASIDDQTLAVIRAPIDDQSLAEIRAPIDDQALAVIRDYSNDDLTPIGETANHVRAFVPYPQRARPTEGPSATVTILGHEQAEILPDPLPIRRVVDGGSPSVLTVDNNSSDSDFAIRPAILLNARPGEFVAMEDPGLQSLRRMMDLAFPEGRRDDLFNSLTANESADLRNLPLPNPPRNSPEPPEEERRPYQGCRPKIRKQVKFSLRDH